VPVSAPPLDEPSVARRKIASAAPLIGKTERADSLEWGVYLGAVCRGTGSREPELF
jgi:hypothetical protein